jgi:geranylgeranyl diphosphate synthase type I
VFGEEKKLGKSIYSDITEGKQTVLLTFALEHATKEQKQILTQYYGNAEIDGEIYKRIKDIFTTTGALTYSEKKVVAYTDTAKNLIAQLTHKEKEKKLFAELVTFISKRES